MNVTRTRVVSHVPAGIDPVTGAPHTVATVTVIGVDALVLGNGASTWTIPICDTPWDPDAEWSELAVTSILLPAAYAPNATFEVLLHDNRQLYMQLHTRALGAGGLTGLVCVMEFENPDMPGLWVPSRELVARDAGFAANEWTLLGVGNWLIATRQEHMHYRRARMRFHAAAGAADAATDIRVTCYTDGGQFVA